MPNDPLAAFMLTRSEMSPAARLMPEQAAKLSTERKQTLQPPPERELKPETPTQQILVPAGSNLQRAPSQNTPGMGLNTIRPVYVAQQPQQAIAVAQRMERIDPLEKFLAGRLKQNMPGPAEKLAMGHTRGMQM